MCFLTKKKLRLAVCSAAGVLVLTGRAVTVGLTTQTTPPADATAWNYVGLVNGASGVFLGTYGGSGWVLTASHVGAHDFTLNGTTYTYTGTSFSNFTYGGVTADLTLFQISTAPSLSNLALAHPSAGSTVELIGFGGGKSWGDNTIYGYGTYTLSGTSLGGPGVITLASGLSGLGGQGVGGDSGGGLFYEFGGTWYLTGILSGADPLTINGVSLGNGTIAVDLVYYVGQIGSDIGTTISAIPEPATWGEIGGASALLAAAIRRRRATRH